MRLHKGERATLQSETFSPNKEKAVCFTFWYHAYGSSIGSLRIYSMNDADDSKTLLWEISGQQSKDEYDWQEGVLPITNIENDYKIAIEGTVGSDKFSSITGDIA